MLLIEQIPSLDVYEVLWFTQAGTIANLDTAIRYKYSLYFRITILILHWKGYDLGNRAGVHIKQLVSLYITMYITICLFVYFDELVSILIIWWFSINYDQKKVKKAEERKVNVVKDFVQLFLSLSFLFYVIFIFFVQ